MSPTPPVSLVLVADLTASEGKEVIEAVTHERDPRPAYEPRTGETVRDTATGRVGRVMGNVGPRYQLRPLNGGREWEAEPMNIELACQSDAMSGAVAEANTSARWGL